ncbi:hypothetical protein AVEN_209431-1 [Araneus ventricosus]|uniref:Uncharacterized protein n=1 Tax=Araneus ventricosus TaxID=182803 RepID=A0A4Y2TL15_ARAVE|nr:hypothetical protein AVEN_209431-1 [Araneus ventricosus]
MREMGRVSCKKEDFFPFPVAWLSRDSWRDVKCGPLRIFIFPVCLPVLHHFFLKVDFRKDIGALTDSGSLSDSAASFANLSASSFPS